MEKERRFRFNREKMLRAVPVLLVFAALVFIAVAMVKPLLSDGGAAVDPTAVLNSGPPEDMLARGVIIDAGHGGSDPGAISTITGTHEADLNLAVAKLLAERLERIGVPVVMTRSDSDAIGETKDKDMQKRREIAHNSDAYLMVSIHMNSFPDNPDVHGPQVHFQTGSSSSKTLARAIQTSLNSATDGSRGIFTDDLYVLNGNPMPSVLIECGFLTNENEATELEKPSYQAKLVEAIIVGLFTYGA